MRYMIDEPTPFDSLGVWEMFLADMNKLDRSKYDVLNAIKNAKHMINEKTNG